MSTEVEAQVSSKLELAAGGTGTSGVTLPSDGGWCICTAGTGVVRGVPDGDCRYATPAVTASGDCSSREATAEPSRDCSALKESCALTTPRVALQQCRRPSRGDRFPCCACGRTGSRLAVGGACRRRGGLPPGSPRLSSTRRRNQGSRGGVRHRLFAYANAARPLRRQTSPELPGSLNLNSIAPERLGETIVLHSQRGATSGVGSDGLHRHGL